MKSYNVNLRTLCICPVCGYDKLDEPPYKDGYPTYEICPYCGFEYGFDDDSEGHTFDSYREKWVNEGYKFAWLESKPLDWNEELAISN